VDNLTEIVGISETWNREDIVDFIFLKLSFFKKCTFFHPFFGYLSSKMMFLSKF